MQGLRCFIVVIFTMFVVVACDLLSIGGGSSEASKVALEKFKPYIAQCGDTYTVAYDNNMKKFWGGDKVYYHRYKKADFIIEEHSTEADKLNGIAWHGKAVYKFSGVKQEFLKTNDDQLKSIANRWEAWEEYREDITVWLTKKNGEWQIGSFDRDLIPLTCAEIPN